MASALFILDFMQKDWIEAISWIFFVSLLRDLHVLKIVMAIRDLTNLIDFFRFNCSNQILNSRFLGKKFIIYWIIITPEEQTCSRKQLISYCIFSSLPWSQRIGEPLVFLKNSATCRKILTGCVNSSFFKIMNLWIKWSNIVGKS